ncbi:2,3-diphosphoglycerate-dependent phosphoglycerate mutase GpmB [Providencia rettgeri]
MLQVYLVRHGETEWNLARRIQGQSDSPLTATGRLQARQVAERIKSEGITHIITSDMGRTLETAQIIASVCECEITTEPRLRELNMGVLEQRAIESLTPEEEQWRKSLIDGTRGGRIPEGESMEELYTRMFAALNSCLDLPEGSRPLIVSHGIALSTLISRIMGVPAYSERRLRLRNCSLSRIDYQNSPWLANGWIVETAGEVTHLSQPALDEQQG